MNDPLIRTINLIDKGQWRDNNPELQPERTYYESMNGRIVSRDGKNFAWVPVRGHAMSFAILDEFEPIGIGEIRNKLVIMAVKTVAGPTPPAGVYGHIAEVSLQPDGIISGNYTVRYCHKDLNFSLDHPIGYEICGYYEGSDLRNIYWTDNNNSPGNINLADFPLIASGSLTVPTVYLVTSGSITHNFTVYYYGQIFTAVNANFTGTGTVVEYLPVGSLYMQPKYQHGEFYYDSLIDGHLKYGRYFYCWKLITSAGGESPWSYLTYPVSVPVVSVAGNGEDAYQDQENEVSTLYSDKGIRFNIDLLGMESTYSKIKVAAFFSDAFNSASPGIVFLENTISGQIMTINHVDQVGSETVNIQDIAITQTSIDRCKTLAILQHELALGNIHERSELNWTFSGSVNEEKYELPTDDYETRQRPDPGGFYSSPVALAGHDPIIRSAPTHLLAGNEKGYIFPKQWYKVEGTVGHSINYDADANGVAESISVGTFFQGSIFAGSVNDRYVNNVGTPTVRPYIRIKRYTSFAGPIVYKDIPINTDYLDYKGVGIDHDCVGYWPKETYRLGVLFYDLRGIPFYTKWLSDYQVKAIWSNVPVLQNAMMQGYQYVSGGAGSSYEWWNINAVSLIINGLDVTDIKDQISGFAIVRAERDKVILSEGVLTPCCHFPNNGSGTPLGFDKVRACPSLGTNFSLEWTRYGGFYNYLTPELYFGGYNGGFLNTHILKIETYLRTEFENNPFWNSGGFDVKFNGMGPNQSYDHTPYQKFYKDVNPGAGAPIHDENAVDTWLEVAFDGEATHWWNGIPYYFEAESYGYDSAFNWRWGQHVRSYWFHTAYAEASPTHGFGYTGAAATACYISHKNNKTTLYGGTTDYAKAQTEYIFCGHYQPITPAVLASINNAGSYIFNGIQIFGGDCWTAPLDLQRLQKNWTNHGLYPTVRCMSHGIIFPVHCSVNHSLRHGYHFARDREYDTDPPYNTYKLWYDTSAPGWILEEFLFNKTFASENIGREYPALPFGYKFVDEFDHRVRWSDVKVDGALIDQFRVFPVDNFKDVEAAQGSITNIRAKFGRLYYFQEHGLGYLPINERSVVSDVAGMQTELGTGGTFDNYYEKSDWIGNQHQFGLVETPETFIWIDVSRRLMIEINGALQYKKISLEHGHDSFFTSEMPGNIENNDHILAIGGDRKKAVGIVGVYDPKNDQVLFSIYSVDATGLIWYRACLVYDRKLQSYQGFMFEKVNDNISTYTRMVLGKGLKFSNNTIIFTDLANKRHKAYVHDYPTADFGKMFENTYDSYIKLNVNGGNQLTKVFDKYEMVGNDKFFSTVQYKNGYDLITPDQNVTESVVSDTNVHLHREYGYVKKRWFFNTPIDSNRRRFEDYSFIQLTLTVKNVRKVLVKLVSLITKYRQTY